MNDFADAVIRQRQATDSREGNVYARKYISAFQKLVAQYGDEGRTALARLLADEDETVRTTAAAYLLRFMHEEAMAVLLAASHGTGFDSFCAAQCIDNWNSGCWELDK